MWSTVGVVCVLLMHQAVFLREEVCTDLNFYTLTNDVLSVDENDFVNVTFWIKELACNQTNTLHKVTVHTQINTGVHEYDGRVTSSEGNCSGRLSIQCISLTGPATLYKPVNRSHVQIEWELSSTPSDDLISIQKKLNVFYPPAVKSLTVDKSEVSGNCLINDLQEVSISCTFHPGNPPRKLFLFDKTGNEIKATRGEDYLNLSLTLRCEHDWPTVRCEGSGSKTIKSVSFLVRCRPQFIDRYPTVVYSGRDYRWTFKIKVHTTVVEKCLLTSSSRNNSNILVNCTLIGDLPYLLLTLVISENNSLKGENWSLGLRVGGGFSETLNFRTHASALLDFYNFKGNTLFVEENNYVNLTFWLNTSACNQSDMVYRIKVQTLTNVGNVEYDGRIIQVGNSCTEVTRVFAGCLTPEGPGRLYKIMNQSHVETEWTWTWKDIDSDELATASKRLNLQPARKSDFTKYLCLHAIHERGFKQTLITLNNYCRCRQIHQER
ncbi:uncharacterized protein LOC112568830 isoform X2 [Pomacea canaliculata]|uniref:uncharacterized protein LOC112568830 isoform X2 n=1 Tax=Pomacea canaliculata TaxID=400727 RepID=UPI000D72BCDB|nr:uncharacterized protein LOC112568830 isoform X2 [Pomacea canaliculata]